MELNLRKIEGIKLLKLNVFFKGLRLLRKKIKIALNL